MSQRAYRISPSNFDRVARCYGSPRIERIAHNVLPEKEKPAADLGTYLHDLVFGTMDNTPGITIPTEHHDFVMQSISLLRGFEDVTNQGEKITGSEVKIDLSDIGMEAGGRIDRLMAIPGEEIWVQDLKTGDFYTDHPMWNWQMRLYAYGAWRRYGGMFVNVSIVQPKLGDDSAIRIARFTGEQMADFGAQAADIIRKANAPDAPLTVGSKQCQFCSGRDICPARVGLEVVNEGGENLLPMVRDGVSENLAVENWIMQADPAARGVVYDRLLLFKAWVSRALATFDEKAIKDCVQIAGYKIGRTNPHRAWKEPAVALGILRELCLEKGKNPEDLQHTELISPSDAEKLLGKSKAIKERMSGLMFKPEGDPKLVKGENDDE